MRAFALPVIGSGLDCGIDRGVGIDDGAVGRAYFVGCIVCCYVLIPYDELALREPLFVSC